MKKRVTMYWLIPTRIESELFEEIIRILAQQFDGPIFLPHLTLCRAENAKSVRQILRRVRAEPVRLRIRGITHSAKFTKTLFVRFTPSKSLQRLVVELGGKRKALADPHLSLMYKKLQPRIRRDLAAAVKLPFRAITFDAVCAMSCVSATATKQDVQLWRKLATKRLSG